MYYSMSRLSVLDVKWADLFDVGTNPTFFENHSNPYFELIVAADGMVHFEAGGNRVVLQAGDSLLLGPWEQHNGWNPKERQGKFYWAQFSCAPGMSSITIDGSNGLNKVHTQRTELRTTEIGHVDLLILPRLQRNRQPYKLLSRFEELVDTLKQPRGYFRYQCTQLMSEMLGFIANDFLDHRQVDTTFPVSYFTFRRLVNHLNNFYEADLSREKLERTLDYKYEYLCQVFKKYAGVPMLHYIQQLRVQRAKYLLDHSGKSIQEIAREVGYPDQFYFSRLFKKFAGMAPQHYRDGKHNPPPGQEE